MILVTDVSSTLSGVHESALLLGIAYRASGIIRAGAHLRCCGSDGLCALEDEVLNDFVGDESALQTPSGQQKTPINP